MYHHTNEAGEKGIRSSGEIWSSSWNIQGNQKLKNISYVYFTSIEKIRNEFDLVEIAMSETGAALLLPTNMPPDPTFALPLSVYRQEARDRNKTFKFWVDVEVIYPSHLWLHIKEGDPAYYEVVLPKILRIGVKAGVKIPFKGMSLKIASSDQKSFDYVIVGDADTAEGLAAPYNEEETIYLAKVDNVPGDLEIIGRWYQMKNTHLYPSMDVELAEIVKLPPS